MENTNTVNSVNIDLSQYNVMQSNLDSTRDLLAKTTAELNVLRNQEPQNKLIVVEEKVYDPKYGGNKLQKKLIIDVNSPQASEKLLDVISKVETSELTQKIAEKDVEIETVKHKLENFIDVLEAERRNNKRDRIAITTDYDDKIRKIKKANEEVVLELTEDKETLTKALSNLKKDKTAEQVELAHVEELKDMEEKVNALSEFKTQVIINASNPLKLRKFINNFNNAKDFNTDNSWFNKLYNYAYTASDRIEAFVRMIKNVGKIERSEEKVSCGTQPSSYITYVTECDCCGERW
jgi:hypothetical protein